MASWHETRWIKAHCNRLYSRISFRSNFEKKSQGRRDGSCFYNENLFFGKLSEFDEISSDYGDIVSRWKYFVFAVEIFC